MEQASQQFQKLTEVINRLRGPQGCPWDQRQTPATLKTYLIEEVYELIDAIDSDRSDHIEEEIGDLFFQLLLLQTIYAEKKACRLENILAGITAKMIRRHPHVFGDSTAMSEEDLRRQWNAIKTAEKISRGEEGEITDHFDSIPRALPALRRTYRVYERAKRHNIPSPSQEKLTRAILDQAGELAAGNGRANDSETASRLGTMLFTCVALAAERHLVPEDLLQQTTTDFIENFRSSQKKGKSPRTTGESLLDLWHKTSNG